MSKALTRVDPWRGLTRWTTARIAMGCAGVSTPTSPLLAFNSDHALARDAIYAPLNVARLKGQFQDAGFETIAVTSRVKSRAEYLRRPDLGRSLAPDSAEVLARKQSPSQVLTVVVADGLSALAPMTHALPLLELLRGGLADWVLDTIVLATEARVALGDEIGQIRGAEAVLVLIGERPGLKSPDSLGAYLTYRPRVGRMDSERNCVSNIRPEGLSYEQAAFRLVHLLDRARILGATGVTLKDNSDHLPDAPAKRTLAGPIQGDSD
ncbi:MAG: ethanolamine ammonia-lyase subunit EutC [Acidobacteria bacterium]|nr:ethanolamine ammonia-lyase subunit EutC [Acidobacteriota bacterium]